ncbi:hypothetical protein GCM10020366_11400 [Saccharopolyspora gregorii]|uniref:Uncharacterized protein n=1 Tax=Saccharopolyspora gregorii TaxID=33914 RepID=A0ABP6RL72_9PSEU
MQHICISGQRGKIRVLRNQPIFMRESFGELDWVEQRVRSGVVNGLEGIEVEVEFGEVFA